MRAGSRFRAQKTSVVVAVAVIDKYLEGLVKHKGEALVLRPGATIELVIAGVPRPATSKPVSEEQISALLAEALGPAYAPGVSGKRSYPYQSPLGLATLHVDDGPMGLQVRIQLAGRRHPRAAATRPGQPVGAALHLHGLGGDAAGRPSLARRLPKLGPLPALHTPAPVLVSGPPTIPGRAPSRGGGRAAGLRRSRWTAVPSDAGHEGVRPAPQVGQRPHRPRRRVDHAACPGGPR